MRLGEPENEISTFLFKKESFQCLICAKWFAIPPVKHMRGHMVTFRDEKRRYVPLTGLGGNCHVCLSCFQVIIAFVKIRHFQNDIHNLRLPFI